MPVRVLPSRGLRFGLFSVLALFFCFIFADVVMVWRLGFSNSRSVILVSCQSRGLWACLVWLGWWALVLWVLCGSRDGMAIFEARGERVRFWVGEVFGAREGSSDF